MEFLPSVGSGIFGDHLDPECLCLSEENKVSVKEILLRKSDIRDEFIRAVF